MSPSDAGARSHDPDRLRLLVAAILEGAGADPLNATTVADHLVDASLCGVDTHGIIQVPGYVAAIRAGHLDPRARPTIDAETASTVRVRGHWGFGHVTALEATRYGIDRARDQGCAAVAIVECGHIGRVGHFVEMAADAGVIALMFAGGFGVEVPAAVPFGGSERVLHTNPIAFAFPGGEEGGPTFDFATTTVAGMKVSEAKRHGTTLPPGAIVDRDGAPSVDPEAFYDGGALLPFGGHKGYAIAAEAEWLGRIATGADAFSAASPAEPVLRHQGVLAMFLRVDAFEASDVVRSSSDAMARRVRNVAPAPGFDRVRLPGDPERATRAERSETGIPVDESTWAALSGLADELGVEQR
jgi:LDH2 family malate/lactate/ureidoglycolate dehydrogenase